MKVIMTVVAAVAAVTGFAGSTFYWTGSVDGRWDNPANWEDDGGQTPAAAPGVIWDGVTGSPAQASGDTAVFGASSRATIDLTNVYSIGNVTVTSDAPVYTFGTSVSNTQVLPFEPGGTMTVESGAAAPIISAFGTQANGNYWTEDNKTKNNYATVNFDNKSSGLPKILSLGYVRRRPGSLRSWFLTSVCYKGNGVEIAGDVYELDGATYAFTLNDSGTYRVSANTTTSKIQAAGGNKTINIDEGVSIKWYTDTNTQGFFLTSSGKLTVNGPGKVVIRDKFNANSFSNRGAWNLNGNTELTLNCPIEVLPSGDNWALNPNPQITLGTSTGLVRFRNTGNSLKGPIVYVGDSAVTAIFDSISELDECPGLILGSRKYNSSTTRGWFAYDGANQQEFTGYLNFTNNLWFGIKSMTAGGTLKVSSRISCDTLGETANLRFYSYPGRLIYNCTLADAEACPALSFEGWPDSGEGIWITEDAELPTAGITLEGVRLVLEGSGRTLPPITVAAKNSKITMSGPVTNFLTTVNVTAENKTLDLVTSGGAVFKVAGATVRTAAPAGVTVNGKPARFNARGELTDGNVTVPDVEVGAKGSVIVEDEEKVVGITSEGTTGNNTLDQNFVLVKGYAQQSDYPSTLALGSDDGLGAGFVGIDVGSAALTIGDTAGQGRLTTEALFNDGNSPLTINAQLDSGRLITSGKGEIVLNGGMKEGYSLSAMTNSAGVLRLAAGEYTTDNDNAWIRLNGGRTIIGDGVVLRRADEATATGMSANDAQIQVGYAGQAVLEIESGAVVSNQIGTCRSQSSGNGTGSASAVYQHGGTVYNTPGSGGELRMIGGNGYTYGFWGLDSGSLTLDKEVAFGYTRGIGIYQQTGGVLNHLSRNIRLGYNGFAHSAWYQSGGTAQLAGNQIPNSVRNGDKRTSFTLTGPGTQFICGAGETGFGELDVGHHNLADPGATNAYVWVNINDGARLIAYSINRNGVHRNELIPEELYDTNKVFLNVDGGVIQLSATYGVNAFGSFYNGNTSGVDRVTIYKGGMTIDMTSRGVESGNTAYVRVFVHGATGKGVKSVEWTDRPELEMVGSPYVWIIGDGEGAAAHAYFDMNQRKVTEVRVTSPGVNYTWAKAVFQYKSNYDSSKILWTNDVVLADNEIDGGLKVTGYGVFDFDCSYFPADYRGPTEITGSATLRTEFDNAINSASKLICNGGTLDLRGHAQSFSDVETLADTYMRNGKPTITGLSVDVARAVAGTPKNVNVSLFNFAANAPMTLTNIDETKWDRAANYTLVTFSALPSNLDMSTALAQVPAGWQIKMAGTSLKLSAKKALTVILR